jgi:hypothetical protein
MAGQFQYSFSSVPSVNLHHVKMRGCCLIRLIHDAAMRPRGTARRQAEGLI